jgi:hypothetical protein
MSVEKPNWSTFVRLKFTATHESDGSESEFIESLTYGSAPPG